MLFRPLGYLQAGEATSSHLFKETEAQLKISDS